MVGLVSSSIPYLNHNLPECPPDTREVRAIGERLVKDITRRVEN